MVSIPEFYTETFFEFGDAILREMFACSVGEDSICFDDVRTSTAVDERVGAAGVIADHSADTTPVGSGCLRAEKESVGFAGEVEFIAYDAGFDEGIAFVGVDFMDAVHIAAYIRYDAVSDHLSGDGCASCARDDIRVASPRFVNEGTDVVFVGRVGDTVGDFTIDAGVRRVGYLMQAVGEYFHHRLSLLRHCRMYISVASRIQQNRYSVVWKNGRAFSK